MRSRQNPVCRLGFFPTLMLHKGRIDRGNGFGASPLTLLDAQLDRGATGARMLVPINKHPKMPAEVDQSRPLVAKLELDPPNVARVLAAAIDEILDRDLGQRRRLITGQSRKIDTRIAIQPARM